MLRNIRPETLKFPQIYSTFRARDKTSDDVVDYLIQELPKEYFGQAVNLLLNEYLPEETLHACRNLVSNSEAIREVRDDWQKKLSANISIACFKSDGSDLVGVSILGIINKDDDDESESWKTEELSDVVRLLNHISIQHNVFELYNIDKFLTIHGLAVSYDYRKRGVACELLKASVDVAKILNLKIISSTFTTFGAQKTAEKSGYKETFSITFDELQENFPSFDFTKLSTEFVKIFDVEI
ncbi:hypothetical protein PVAND_013682 [Polypedilum vanderplanki]|uniref:N-acetyltransferase domain-containing protein n=1 Tax=Polypedilum vanderplanki TaxID=319348 RepID=A0A9J6CR84_POLVA|nr:hypothetical protein PVAND_013682 [Polypedilum vanderplanki]